MTRNHPKPEPVAVGELFTRLAMPPQVGYYRRIEDTADAYGKVNAEHVTTQYRLWVDPTFMVPVPTAPETAC